MVTVSVVIPVFNQERYLALAIDSVLAQTYRDLELIVVDDGSTDGTLEVIRGYGSRIRALRKPNGGNASALNLGIQEASGEWIAWLSSDDLWEPNKLNRQMEAAQALPSTEFVFTDDVIIDSEGMVLERRHFSLPSSKTMRLLKLARGCFIDGSSVLIHRNVFRRVGLFDEGDRLTSDYDLWLRVVKDCDMIHIPEPLVRYRVHGAQASKNHEAMMRAWHGVLSRSLPEMGPVLGALAAALIVKDELMLMPWRIRKMPSSGLSLSQIIGRVTGLLKVLVGGEPA